VPLDIKIGLWIQETYDAYAALPPEDQLPALCELSPELTSAIDADVWAPRWTLGLQEEEVARMHGEGRRAFVWTLDQEFAIDDFISDGDYDGILTNYPTVVAWYYYTRGGA
jgi:glycerophosphoryl diester phosphodiesterase